MKPEEYFLLADFLYDAIYCKDEETIFPRTIIQEPALYIYIENFGNYSDDTCLVCQVKGMIIGAVWVRIIDGFATIDKQTPELAISVKKEYRGQGVGTLLLRSMLEKLQGRYKQVSLSVQKENDAFRWYQTFGFETILENKNEMLMVYKIMKEDETNLHEGYRSHQIE